MDTLPAMSTINCFGASFRKEIKALTHSFTAGSANLQFRDFPYL
jgi:hypothetical protein